MRLSINLKSIFILSLDKFLEYVSDSLGRKTLWYCRIYKSCQRRWKNRRQNSFYYPCKHGMQHTNRWTYLIKCINQCTESNSFRFIFFSLFINNEHRPDKLFLLKNWRIMGNQGISMKCKWCWFILWLMSSKRFMKINCFYQVRWPLRKGPISLGKATL